MKRTGRGGAAPETARYRQRIETPLGAVTLVSDGEALCRLTFDAAEPAGETAGLPVFDETRRWLQTYFSGRDPITAPKLSLSGTPFQQRVWREIQRIPFGKTESYAALAARLGTSARAIGRAAGQNPVLLIVPCHRVVGKNGALTGYAGGQERKRALLANERGGAGIRMHGSECINKPGANMGQPV